MRVEEERRARQAASRRRRAEQLKRAREAREAAAQRAALEERREDKEGRAYPALEELVPPKLRPALPSTRGGAALSGVGRAMAVEQRQWMDVSEAELAQQRRAQDERLREERRLKQMQDRIALLKAKMGAAGDGERRGLTSSPAAAAAASGGGGPSRVRAPLTFSASPYALLSSACRPPSSPLRARLSPARFTSPRRRPHPFLRHSPARRRRLSLSPSKQRRGRGDTQQPHNHTPLPPQPPHAVQASPGRAKTSNSSPGQPHALSHEQRRGGVASGEDSSAPLSSSAHSLVEAQLASHMHGQSHGLASTRPSASQSVPSSPPLLSASSPLAFAPLLLPRLHSSSVLSLLDDLVSAVLDRAVLDTVWELNAAEERQRASVVLDEVDDMVEQLERLEDGVTQRWLSVGGTLPIDATRVAVPGRTERRQEQLDDVAETAPPTAPSAEQHEGRLQASGLLDSVAASAPLPLQRRVLPACTDVSPQWSDPTGVSLAESR